MLNQLLNTLINILVVMGLVWLGLAMISAKWPVWRSVRHGYLSLLRALLVGVARFLWSPEFPREGGGHAAQKHDSLDAEEARWD